MMPRAIVTYELYIAALKLGIAIVPSSEMLRTKDLQYRITHGEIDAVISFDSLTKEFENVKEYDQLKKFIVAGHKEDWVSIEDEKEKVSDDLKGADTTRDDLAILSYTSGTTGNPKAVTHSHGWGMPICKWHQNIGYAYKRMILYGQLQHQGGKSGCGVHSYLF